MKKKKNVKMGTSSPVILPHQTGLTGAAGMADCTPLKKGGRYVAAFLAKLPLFIADYPTAAD